MRVKVTASGVYNGPVDVPDGSTVEVALRKANVSAEGSKQLLVDSREASLYDILHEGQTIFVVPNVRGNK